MTVIDLLKYKICIDDIADEYCRYSFKYDGYDYVICKNYTHITVYGRYSAFIYDGNVNAINEKYFVEKD